jgi:hypothetical protein
VQISGKLILCLGVNVVRGFNQQAILGESERA